MPTVIMIQIRFIALLLLVPTLLLTNCASTGFLMAKARVTLFAEAYPPRVPGAQIDVFITTKPTQEYVEFAQITCQDTNEQWVLDQIRKKAREIGADGIIIVGKAGTEGVGIPIGNITYIVSEEYGKTAIAIKYK
jgi:hypothetical protein